MLKKITTISFAIALVSLNLNILPASANTEIKESDKFVLVASNHTGIEQRASNVRQDELELLVAEAMSLAKAGQSEKAINTFAKASRLVDEKK